MSVRMAALMTLIVISAAMGSGHAEVLGVVGMNPVEQASCIAVRVPLADDEAIAGIEWFNNDGTIIYPEVRVCAGLPDEPGLLVDGTVVGVHVGGASSDWSGCVWQNDYCADTGVYVVFVLPEGSVWIGDGAGGGAALGYVEEDQGLPGWLSLEGEFWCRLDDQFGIAARPRIVERSIDTVVLIPGVKRAGADEMLSENDDLPLVTAMFRPAPNPFNPKTNLSFSLATAMPVKLQIIDLQGALVSTLVDRTCSAGRHTVPWLGLGDGGREVASGVYVVRMAAGQTVQTYRLTLIR